MSYYKTRNIRFYPDKNVIKVCTAENNVTPKQYRTCEYMGTSDATFSEKLEAFLVSCLEGNFQLLQSCPYYQLITEDLRKLYNICSMDLFKIDWELKTKYDGQLRELVVKQYGIPFILDGAADFESTASAVREYEKAVGEEIIKLDK